MINVTETDITLKPDTDITLTPRKSIGLIHPMPESIARVESAAVSDNELPHSHPDLSNIQFGENLTTKQNWEAAQNLIDQYDYVFALNPKNPNKENVI